MRLKQFFKDIFLRSKSEAELDEEISFHLQMQEQDNLRKGMSEQEAHRSSRVEFGGVEQIKEEVRAQRFGFWLESIFKDVFYGLRLLRKTPSLTFVSIFTLSLAIGACTSLFSIYNAVFLRPLPYPSPHELVQIWEANQSKAIPKIGVNARNLQDWRDRSQAFSGIAAYYTMGRTLTSQNGSEVVLTSQVSADFFRIFRTDPLIGRTFSKQESEAAKYNNALGVVNPDRVLVLSYALWQRRFGGDAQIIGKNIILIGKRGKSSE